MRISGAELDRVFRLEYEVRGQVGWVPRARSRVGYYTPAYRVNSRRRLATFLADHGFIERASWSLDDCRISARSRPIHHAELILWRTPRSSGIGYPESCPLGLYERAVA